MTFVIAYALILTVTYVVDSREKLLATQVPNLLLQPAAPAGGVEVIVTLPLQEA